MVDESLQPRQVPINSYRDVRPVLQMMLNQLEQPFITKLEEVVGIGREKLFYFAALFLVFYLVFGPCNALLCTLIGVVYPAYQSLSAVHGQSKIDVTQWLIYWCLFALFSQIDCIVSRFAIVFPCYLVLKTIMLLYLALPQTYGAHNFYVMYVEPMMEPCSFVDAIITKVKQSPLHRFTDLITEHELQHLCRAATDVFRMQPTLVRIQPPVVVVGDIHGQFSDLLRIFTTHGHPPVQQYVFLGDYVDRGPQSLETIILLLCYKVKYPSSFVLLRGNHETANINKVYGFYEEIERRYQRPGARQLYCLFNHVFAWMPFAGLIGDKILCMHGGISDKIHNMDQLSNLDRPQTKPQLRTLEMDLLWADPSPDIQGIVPNTRGAGVMFGADQVERVRQLLDIDYIIRAHQLVYGGVEYFADKKLITVFSAPRYTNKNNTGATLTIAPDLTHVVTRFPPA